MPGLSGGIELTARDESRHIRYGVYLLQRLVSEDPAIWEVINRRMNEIFPHAMGVIAEFWEPYDEANGPFGLTMNEFVEFSAAKFDARMKVMERDRGKDMADIEKAVLEDLEADERELSEAFA
jgi:ribonucleoside-diphosphate reductase beta chain